jgi:hypothetical protein
MLNFFMSSLPTICAPNGKCNKSIYNKFYFKIKCITIHNFSENHNAVIKTKFSQIIFKEREISIHVPIILRHAILEEYSGGITFILQSPEHH